MGIDIKLLRAFRCVASNRSITKAAETLKVTQPAVSSKIGRLEQLVGFPLFVRSRTGMSLTAEGQQFLDEAATALDAVERLGRVSEGIRNGTTGRLVIASHPSASISLLPAIVAKFSREHPDARIRMVNRTSETVRGIFPAEAIDIGIAELPVEIANVSLTKHAIECVAVLPASHPACVKSHIAPADLAGFPFIALPPERILSHRIRDAFEHEEVAMNTVAEIDYFSSICAMVAEGAGISIVDRWSALMFQALGLKVRPFVPAIRYEIGVMTSANRPISQLAATFLKSLNDTLSAPEDLKHE